MKTIVIRTYGGRDSGYGHFYRCLSLSKAIQSLNDKKPLEVTNIIFIINEELEELLIDSGHEFLISKSFEEDLEIIRYMKEVDLFILDSYLANDDYLKNISKQTRLMLIDDNNDIYDSTIPEILYNGNIHAKDLDYPKSDNQIQLLGLEYLIMKEEYWKRQEEVNKEGILITTGGTDNNNIMNNLLKELKDLNIKTRLIIGPGFTEEYIKKLEKTTVKVNNDNKNKSSNIELIYFPNSLKEYIGSSKLVITTSGSTVYEVLSQKTQLVVFSIADNQDLISFALKRNGVNYIGKYPNIEYDRIKDIVEGEYNSVNNSNTNVFNLIKGDGALKVAKEILNFIL